MKRRMGRILFAASLVIAAACVNAQTPAPAKATTGAAAAPVGARQLAINNQPWVGDFDAMLERRLIRVYAPYSRSLYFIDKGRERGLGAELVREMVENGPFAHQRWLLHTEDAHALYRRFGFDVPGYKVMERPPPER